MTAPIGPGDKVICVNISEEPGRIWFPGEAPVIGAIYTVARVGASPSGIATVWLEEIERAAEVCAQLGFAAGYYLHRFRPAGRGGMFNDLLTAKPVCVGEDA